jgi:hypothetical protein
MTMTTMAQFVSLMALIGTIAPSIQFFTGVLALESMKFWMLIATVVWFVSAPMWMGREE